MKDDLGPILAGRIDSSRRWPRCVPARACGPSVPHPPSVVLRAGPDPRLAPTIGEGGRCGCCLFRLASLVLTLALLALFALGALMAAPRARDYLVGQVRQTVRTALAQAPLAP